MNGVDLRQDEQDALPWPEFRLLAAYITGHESPAISFWKRAVEGEPDEGGAA